MLSELNEIIKKNRPHLASSSITNYSRHLVNLYKKIQDKQTAPSSLDELIDLYFTKTGFNKTLQYLNKNSKYNVRKTLLASIIALCDTEDKQQMALCEKYRQIMMKDINAYNEEQKGQTKTADQEKNWLKHDEIKQVYEDLHKEVLQYKLWSKQSLNKKDYDLLQSFIILSKYILIPPRRIQDYLNLVVQPDDNMNYLDNKKSELVFNSYKTKDAYKEQRVKVDKKLKSLLQRWIKKKRDLGIDSQYVFSRMDGTQYIQPELTAIIQKIFYNKTGKKVSVNLLRHAYISDVVLKDMPVLDMLQEKAEDMGHSINQMLLYKKKD